MSKSLCKNKYIIMFVSKDLIPTTIIMLFIIITQVPILVINNAELRTWIATIAVFILVFPMFLILSQIQFLSSRILFITLLLSLALFHFLYQYLVYSTGLRATGDTAAIEQSLYNLLNHATFSNTIEGQYFGISTSLNHFAVHNSPILLILALPYAIYSSTITLILTKTALFLLTGFLAMWYVQSVSSTRAIPIASLAPFALLIQVPLLFVPDLYESVFIPPLLVWSALAFRLDKPRQFLISNFLLVMVKETMFPILFAWALIAFLRKKRRTYIITPLLIGMLSFVVSFVVVIPFFNGGRSSAFFDQVLPSVLALNCITVADYSFQILSVWGAIPLLSSMSILAIPDLFVNSLLSGGFHWTTEISGRFQIGILVSCFLGTCESIPILAKYFKSKFNIANTERLLWIMVLVFATLGLFRAGPKISEVVHRLQEDWRSDMKCIELVSQTNNPTLCDYQLCGYFSKLRKYGR